MTQNQQNPSSGHSPSGHSSSVAPLINATVEAHCRALRLPTVATQFDRLSQDATRANQTHTSYLATLLGAELEERERHTVERRIKEARLPRFKTLEEFDFAAAPHIPAPLIRELSEGNYLNRAEPVLLIGDSGTGKTHLATGLCIAACQQKKRVRFVTAAGLVNELVEAQHHSLLGRAFSSAPFKTNEKVGPNESAEEPKSTCQTQAPNSSQVSSGNTQR